MTDLPSPSWALRVKAAWRILRGRPVIYRVHFRDCVVLGTSRFLGIYECRFETKDDKPAISFEGFQ